MAEIKAPFNFVPLSESVCYLTEEESNISLDAPFRDGLSGIIQYTVTPESPIFVRNGDKSDTTFSHIGSDNYFIPATSLKGCIRSVLEIMSFSKMSQGLVKNSRYGYRDLSAKSGQEYIKEMRTPTYCGWMYRDGGKYKIADCGIPWRISAEDVDKALGSGNKLAAFVQGTVADRTAQYKYTTLLKEYSQQLTEIFCFSEISPQKPNRVQRDDRSDKKGRIVLTGQPGTATSTDNRKGQKIWRGKWYEFVFPEVMHSVNREVDPSIFEDFEMIHSTSKDYVEWRKNQLNKGEKIPVFFKLDGANISSIGLAFMYKFPYKHSVHDGIPKYQTSPLCLDLAEALFGRTKPEPALKGRIQFAPAFLCENAVVEKLKEFSIQLSSPRSSYYPLYLQRGQTWNSESVNLAGWKRYPTGIDIRNLDNAQRFGTTKSRTVMSPIKVKEGGFKGNIRFFNLRPFELGALLSAMTFHNHEKCRHSIGMAKPYGCGVVKIEVTGIEYSEWQKGEEKIEGYYKCFNDFMNKKLPAQWLERPQIKELFAMAQGMPEDKKRLFSYMQLGMRHCDNEFITAKKECQWLPSFSDIITGKSNQSEEPGKPREGGEGGKDGIWPPRAGATYKGYLQSSTTIEIWHPKGNRNLNKTVQCKIIPDLGERKKGQCKFRISEIRHASNGELYLIDKFYFHQNKPYAY